MLCNNLQNFEKQANFMFYIGFPLFLTIFLRLGSLLHRDVSVIGAWRPSLGKAQSSWLSAFASFFPYGRLYCLCFPVWYVGQDVAFDCIGS